MLSGFKKSFSFKNTYKSDRQVTRLNFEFCEIEDGDPASGIWGSIGFPENSQKGTVGSLPRHNATISKQQAVAV